MFKKMICLLTLLFVVFLVGCNKKDEEPNLNNRGEIILVDDDLITISIVGKVDTPLGAGISIRAINNSEYTVVLQCNETIYNTYVDDKVYTPIFNMDIPSLGERVKPMTFVGIQNVDDLINIKGVFTVDNLDFTTEFGEYEFFIE